MNASIDTIELETRLKTLWGARSMPFAAGSTSPYRSAGIEKVMSQLQQLLQVRASGVLHGLNGVGKTLLIEQIAENLPEKLFSVIRLSHTSLTGADLIRSLCLAMAVPPQMRRSDNIHLIHSHWKQMSAIHPLLIVDEAQNLNAAALEELRLLSCGPRDRRSSVAFSLLLVGDEDLLPRLQMGVHRPLRSRLGFCLSLSAFSQQETQAYLACRWKEVGVNSCPIEEAAQLLIHQASSGMARTINQLCQLAITQAIEQGDQLLSSKHVQYAITHLPWLSSLPVK
jgi:general secretion pathway protein A